METESLFILKPCFNTCGVVVPPVGPIDAKIMFIGEAPNYEEVLNNEPFVGRSGQLLTKLMLEAGIERKNVFITNTVKCYEKRNGPPCDEQIQGCRFKLWNDIKIVKPKIIVTLGKTPTQLLLKLKKTFKMGEYVGKRFNKEYGIVVPLWHPAFLLRNGSKMDKETVEILKGIKDESSL